MTGKQVGVRREWRARLIQGARWNGPPCGFPRQHPIGAHTQNHTKSTACGVPASVVQSQGRTRFDQLARWGQGWMHWPWGIRNKPDMAGYFARMCGGVEMRDGTNRRFAGQHTGGNGLNATPKGRDGTYSRDPDFGVANHVFCPGGTNRKESEEAPTVADQGEH